MLIQAHGVVKTISCLNSLLIVSAGLCKNNIFTIPPSTTRHVAHTRRKPPRSCQFSVKLACGALQMRSGRSSLPSRLFFLSFPYFLWPLHAFLSCDTQPRRLANWPCYTTGCPSIVLNRCSPCMLKLWCTCIAGRIYSSEPHSVQRQATPRMFDAISWAWLTRISYGF